MAWANGNKKWTVPFKSLNGASCRVDIYAKDYDGDTVTELSLSNTNAPGCAAANPFEYSEDNDADLLNVIRYRTGYLRLIEHEYGGLADIYPSVNTDRYIEFYYGDTLDFTGYIMAQDFDNDWVAGPREIDLTICSPLGLASGTYFDWNDYTPPRWVSFFTLIKNSLNLLDGGYSGFYFPQYIPSSSSLVRVLVSLFVNSLTFCPWGDDYDKNTSNLDGIYAPKSVEESLRMICTTFGVILHDCPGTPVFQRMDYQNDYTYFGLDDSREAYVPSVIDLTTIAEIDSKDNKESLVLPLSKIEVTFDGETDVPGMTMARCRGYSRPCALTDKEFCTNNPNIGDFTGTIATQEGIDSSGLIDTDKICLGAFGSGSLSEMIIFRPYLNTWQTNHIVCSYNFFEWNGEGMRLRFRHQYGESIEEMDNPQYSQLFTDSFYATIGVRIVTGDYYYNSQTGWQQIGSSLIYSASWNDGRTDCEIGFLPFYKATPSPLTVEFYAVDGNIARWIHAISNVQLLNHKTATAQYLQGTKDPNKYTANGSPSNEEGSVSAGYDILAQTTNRIRYNENVIDGSSWNDIVNNTPTYPYLLQAQDRLELDMTMTPQTPATLYLNRLTVWNSTSKWRVVARSFEAWNDLHTLTLHHSPIFDY